MKFISALCAGLLFGTGLIVSGMTNPAKIQNFLDIFGQWDPSLAFVMGGAVAVTLPGYWILKRRSASLYSGDFRWPTKTTIDSKLIFGSVLFGIGWGVSGFCPGPAITSITTGANYTISAAFFVIPMLVGLALVKLYSERASRVD